MNDSASRLEQVPRLSLTIERCSQNLLRMSDDNYKEILNYYRRCVLLGRLLPERDRAGYAARLRDFLHKSWEDFIWRTELPEERLVEILETRDDLDELADSVVSKTVRRGGSRTCLSDTASQVLIIIAIIVVFFCLLLWLFRTYLRSRRSETDLSCDFLFMQDYFSKTEGRPPALSTSSVFSNLQKDGARPRHPPAPSPTAFALFLRSCCAVVTYSDSEEDTVLSLPSSGVGKDGHFDSLFSKVRESKKKGKAAVKKEGDFKIVCRLQE